MRRPFALAIGVAAGIHEEPRIGGSWLSKHVVLAILLGASLLANAASVGAIARHWSEIRPVAARVAKQWLRPPLPQQQAALASIVHFVGEQNFASEEERIVFVRDFVYRNSIHRIDEEHERYATDTPRVIEMLWSHRSGGPPPHLSCGPRAYAMKGLLDALGISSRVVMIFSDNEQELVSHTFLEVYDSGTRRWSIQDPDFNVHYVNLETRETASTIELIWGDPDRFVPRSPERDGWEENRMAHVKRDYFEAMVHLSRSAERSTVLVNADRFDPARRYVGNEGMNFYELAKRYYANPAFVTNHTFEARLEREAHKKARDTHTRG